MRRQHAFTLIELIVILAVLAGLLAFLSWFVVHARAEREKVRCMNCQRHIGLSMIMYAGDHDDQFMPLVDADGNKVPAVDNAGVVSSLPARSAFAVLLKDGYLTTTRVFIDDPAPYDQLPERFPQGYRNAALKDLVLGEDDCSFGWDPTKKHSADATCAIVADKPSKEVSIANQGTAANNSDNHRKKGQCVFYNDGHVKWGELPVPDSGDDPDIYTGGAGYEKSTTDAKIVR